jgi:hypothetical protein
MKSANPAHPLDLERYVEDILTPEDIHDARTVPVLHAGGAGFLIAAIILLVLHGANLYLFIATDIWHAVPLLIHLILSIAVAMMAFAQYRKGANVQHLALLAIVSSTTGVLGVAGALLGFLLTVIFRGKSYHFREWYQTMFPTDTLSEAQSVYDSILEGLDENPSRYSVIPFTDVMRLGSEGQKRRALAKMTSRFHPRFAPAFKLALADEHHTIRVQAATAVAKIEREFTAKLERIELARTKQPGNALLTLALAKFYDDYAFTGILDTELERVNRDRAVQTYRSYLQQDPNSNEAWIAIGRLLHRSGQLEEASEWFRSALDRGIRNESMVLWYFECLFRLGNYRELRRAILEFGRGVAAHEALPQDVREAVGLWMQVA